MTNPPAESPNPRATEAKQGEMLAESMIAQHSIDYDPAVGFTATELRNYLGCYQSASFPTDLVKRAIKNRQDYIVARKADPANQKWRWEGDRDKRRFYRVDP